MNVHNVLMLDSLNLQQGHLPQNYPEDEKPMFKTTIVGTNWFQVTTTEGNTFYWHKTTKASVWKVPNELKSAFSAQEDSPAKPSVGRPVQVPVEDDASEDDASEAENDEADIGVSGKPPELDQLGGKSHPEEGDVNQENIDIPMEERMDLFKAMLGEKNISPFHPFDDVLPQLVSDPRYHLLPSPAARREVFDGYCKDKGRDLRHASSSEVRRPINSKEEFESLLKDKVTSTRASWTAFRKEWKKDRRFYGWGRDDREREKRFRDHLKELGDHKVERPGNNRKIRAVQEREEKVKAEQQKIKADVERHRLGASLQGGEQSFMTLLTDTVREPQVKWEQILPQLEADPRFRNSPLPQNHRIRLFHDHLTQLRRREMGSLHMLFETNAPSLETPFSALPLQMILSASSIAKLGLDARRLEAEFRSWQQDRFVVARQAFDAMLTENSFVDFWGRLRKMANEVDNHLKIEDDDIGEIEDEKVDMKTLAKGVDLHDVAKVLKNDKRYNVFDHIPEQREQWLRDYLSNLTESKRSVHISN